MFMLLVLSALCSRRVFLSTATSTTTATAAAVTAAAAAAAALTSVSSSSALASFSSSSVSAMSGGATDCPAASKYPVILGTLMSDRDRLSNAVETAVKIGYRSIDCAPVYFNEDAVGDAIESALMNSKGDGITRDDLFVTSKLASAFHRREHVEIGVRKTLSDLKLGYLDLLLMHWPVAFRFVPVDPDRRGYDDEEIDNSEDGARIDESVSIHETWGAMEDMVRRGLVKSIGVANFNVILLKELMSRATIQPAVNQVELHPYLQQPKLLKYCQRRGVHVQAYSPLGTPGYKESDEPSVLQDAALQKIAERHDCTVAQVCIAWAIQRNTSVVVKSTDEKHLRENFILQGGGGGGGDGALTLSQEEMDEIASLDRGYRFFRPEEWWGVKGMAVFD